MSQCVPSWEVDDPPAATSLPLHDQPSSAAAPLVPLDYEVAELTWENGQLALHGFGGSPRMGKPVVKSAPAAAAGPGANASWSKHQLPGAGGTLESVVNQATGVKLFPAAATAAAAAGGGRTLGLGGWLGGPHHGGDGGVPAVLLDALVPCRDDADAGAGRRVPDAAAAADGDAGRKRTRAMVGVQCSSQGSAAAPRGRRMESTLVTIDTCGTTDDFGITNTATATATATTMATNSVSLDEGGDGSPDTDSVSHSRRSQPQRDGCEEDTKASKKSRAAAIHNQSERKRRDRINQKMKTLQKLVPNSSKTDKASILDEVIEYLKQLQAQVQVMSRMNSMMMPMAMPPQLQMSIMANMAHMAQMAQMAQMGMMDAGAVSRAPAAYPPPPLPPLLHPSAAAAFLPAAAAGTWDGGYAADQMAQQPAAGGSVLPDPLSALIACQSAQPMTMDAYSRMATLFQQFYQQQQQQPAPPPNPKT